MRVIVFYEVHHIYFNRYVAELTKRLTESHRVIYLVDSFVKSNEINVPKGVVLMDVNEIRLARFEEYDDRIFKCFAPRIPDVYWTGYFADRGFRTYQMQHGMYVEYFRRNIFGYFRSFRRRLRYLYYLAKILRLTDEHIIGHLLHMIRKDLGLKRPKGIRMNRKWLSDVIFVWGTYWIRWFKEVKFYDDRTKYIVCGNLDNLVLRDDKRIEKVDPNDWCYVCQTLVEDERMRRSVMVGFLGRLQNWIEGRGHMLHIKLHPRSDITLYKNILSLKNVRATNLIPICGSYIGHYSTLLSLFFDKDVHLVEFEGHPIPEFLIDGCTSLSKCDEMNFDNHRSRHLDLDDVFADVGNPFEIMAAELKNIC